MKLEIFKKGVKLKSWGSVYLGIHKGWIDPNWVIANMEGDNIQFKPEDYSRLLLARDKPLIEFYNVLKELSLENGESHFSVNEDSRSAEYLSLSDDSFPRVYWDFWEVEFVFQTVNSKKSVDEKLNALDILYRDLYYPEGWTEILNTHSIHPLTENKTLLLKEITEYANNKLKKF